MRTSLGFYSSLIVLLLFSQQLSSQHFGGNPARIKWKQINHDSLRVIFPVGMEKQGRRIYENVLQLSRGSRQGIGYKTKKLDIVLQNQSLVPNAYVGLAPLRSEFFASPPQDNRMDGSTNWIDQLSIHEYRHALQFINARYGLTKIGYYLSGESGWAVMMNLSLPDWYFEGDAVLAETQYSSQGRGRIPSFFNNSRTLEQRNIRYTYAKARNGSLIDRVPNHYEMGFLMLAYGSETFGEEIWEKVIRDAGSYRSPFYPFSAALKRHTGLNSRDFYNSSMNYFAKKWDEAQTNDVEFGTKIFNDRKNTVTNYSFPLIVDDSTFYFIKSSYKKIPQLFKQQNGEIKKLFPLGISLQHSYSVHSDKIIWTAMRFDERWGWQQYSDIFRYDLKKGKRQRLSHRKRYYSPSYSADGKEILVFENTIEQEYSLKILHAENAVLKEKIPNPEHLYFSFPRFSMDSTKILSIARNNKGQNALLRIDRKTGSYTELIPFNYNVITRFAESKNGLFLVWGKSGVDNIYYLDKENELYRISSSKSGILDLAVDSAGKRLLYTAYSLNGDVLKSLMLDSVKMHAVESYHSYPKLFDYTFLDSNSILKRKIVDSVEIKSYPLHSQLINLHSWIPIFEDPYYGILLQSENILNTFNLEAGYEYNVNEERAGYFLRGVYAQYYPRFHFGLSSYGRSAFTAEKKEIGWKENSYSLGYSLPFNFSGGLFYRYLNFSQQYSYKNIFSAEGLNESQSLIPSLQDISWNASLLIQRIAAKQHIFTHLGIFARTKYDDAIDNSKSRQLYTELDLCLPGIFANHNFLLESEYQERQKGYFYQFSNSFNYARGFTSLEHDKIYAISANYHFPLFYPDWGFGGISYFYRLRMNLFFDYSKKLSTGTREYNSAGAELIFDSRIFNVLDLSYGIRYTHLLNSHQFAIDPEQEGLLEFFIPFVRF